MRSVKSLLEVSIVRLASATATLMTVAALNGGSGVSPAFAAENDGAPVITKNGRQYLYDLQKRLDLEEGFDLEKVFKDVRANLPKTNAQASLVSGLDALAKLASAACSYASLMNQDWNDVDGLYNSMLDRSPTERERSQAILDADGVPSFFANCFMLALHPEFLRRK